SPKKPGRRRFVASVQARIGTLGCGVTVTLALLLVSLPLMSFVFLQEKPLHKPAQDHSKAEAAQDHSKAKELRSKANELQFASAQKTAKAVPEVRVLKLEIRRFANEIDGERPRGELGKDTFRVRLNDRVYVEALLSEPAYAYLIAFNPTDKPEDREQLLP